MADTLRNVHIRAIDDKRLDQVPCYVDAGEFYVVANVAGTRMAFSVDLQNHEDAATVDEMKEAILHDIHDQLLSLTEVEDEAARWALRMTAKPKG